jgi:hypothetical protein
MVNNESPPAGVRAVVVAIHGILTRTTTRSWPDLLRAYLAHECSVVTRDYSALPIAPLNVFIKNRVHASALASELEILPRDLPIHFVAHSNGCDIA